MHDKRSDFGQRVHHELPFMHKRMRQGKPRYLQNLVVIQKDIDIDNTVMIDSVAFFRAAQLLFNNSNGGKEVFNLTAAFKKKFSDSKPHGSVS